MLRKELDSKLHSEAGAIFEAQAQVDQLIKDYIAKLLASNADVASYAKTLTAIIDSISDVLVVFDKDENVVLANRAAVEFVAPAPVAAKRVDMFSQYKFFKSDGVTPLVPEEFPLVAVKREKRPITIEALVTGGYLPPEGVWVRATNSPILDANGELIGSVVHANDITERKRLEQQRNALSSLITHDIKNYLAAEDFMFSMVANEFADKLDDAQRAFIVELRKGNRRYIDLANTLLELFRADMYALESCRTRVDVADLLRAAVDLNKHEAQLAGIPLNLNADGKHATVEAIPAALQQAFHNIIQNSVEVSTRGQAINVAMSITPASVVLTIEDQGPGMPADQVAKLFARTHAASNIPTSTRTTGFGLYLSRLIIEAHGGTIACRSRPGKGTLITIELPLG